VGKEIAMPDSSTKDATNAIRRTHLTPIEHKILVDFIEQAVTPAVAAREVLRRLRCSGPERPAEEILRELKEDWRRLVATGRCHVPRVQQVS
jgi:hypothetical protein